MQEEFQLYSRSAPPCDDPHRGEAVRVRGVREEIQPPWQQENAHDDTYDIHECLKRILEATDNIILLKLIVYFGSIPPLNKAT